MNSIKKDHILFERQSSIEVMGKTIPVRVVGYFEYDECFNPDDMDCWENEEEKKKFYRDMDRGNICAVGACIRVYSDLGNEDTGIWGCVISKQEEIHGFIEDHALEKEAKLALVEQITETWNKFNTLFGKTA